MKVVEFKNPEVVRADIGGIFSAIAVFSDGYEAKVSYYPAAKEPVTLWKKGSGKDSRGRVNEYYDWIVNPTPSAARVEAFREAVIEPFRAGLKIAQEKLVEEQAAQLEWDTKRERYFAAKAAGPELLAAAQEVMAEIKRLNEAAGHTVVNPAATQLLAAAIKHGMGFDIHGFEIQRVAHKGVRHHRRAPDLDAAIYAMMMDERGPCEPADFIGEAA